MPGRPSSPAKRARSPGPRGGASAAAAPAAAAVDRDLEQERFKPFVHPRHVQGPLALASRALAAFFLFFPRVFGMAFCFFSMLGVCYVVRFSQRLENLLRGKKTTAEDLLAPPRGWRAYVVRLSSIILARLCLFVYGFYWIRTTGTPPKSFLGVPTVKGLVISNHVSYLDILFGMATFAPGFVAKEAVSRAPVIGTICTTLGSLYVDRSAAGGTVGALKRRIAAGPDAYPPLYVFPEGTTSNGRRIMAFKSGAFVPGEPITAVVLRYPHRPGGLSPSYESVHAGRHLLDVMTNWVNHLSVHWLPTYAPSPAEKRDPKLYAANMGRAVARALAEGRIADEAAGWASDVDFNGDHVPTDVTPETADVVNVGLADKADYLKATRGTGTDDDVEREEAAKRKAAEEAAKAKKDG